MTKAKDALGYLKAELEGNKKKTILTFPEFLEVAGENPKRSFRNIFQLFHDMVTGYVGKGVDEYPEDPESIGFVKYDCSKIFSAGTRTPFFPDRLFANRLVRQIGFLRQGSQQNRIYVYKGPHGSGKSTFLNNLLRTVEEYTNTEEGRSFELFWEIETSKENGKARKIEVPCPSHDYPILLIPKSYRADFLEKLLSGRHDEFKRQLFSEKEYEWVFEGEVCTICKSIFGALFDKFGDVERVWDTVRVRPYKFDRRLGEGISVFNPGDKPPKEMFLTDRRLQENLDKFFGANVVKYLFSRHARTNNGIYVLMDIKSNNEERLLELHNIISEGVHKVIDVEERINSLFLALMNPEDKKKIEEKNVQSFQGRIQYNEIRYVMDVPTEINIYHSIFGEQIDKRFLPRVLDHFARVVISSRMKSVCEPLREWLPDLRRYKKYCDESGLLLRMEIYGGVIPPWLSEEDKKKCTAQIRKKLIAEGENEGDEGISGRESIRIFSEFFSRYGSKPNLINISNVVDFFKKNIGRDERDKYIPKDFIASLVNWYNYVVLSEVKEALYFYNKEQIVEDILHYLCAVNYDPGNKVRCQFTGKEFEVTDDFLKMIYVYVTGRESNNRDAAVYARNIQKKFAETVARDPNKAITETELYQELYASYMRNLKEKSLQPFLKNDNFREAVKAFGTPTFDTFDTRLREHIAYMIKNLEKVGYTEQGAKEICYYVIEQKLFENFA